jgi:hypothetical protein
MRGRDYWPRPISPRGKNGRFITIRSNERDGSPRLKGSAMGDAEESRTDMLSDHACGKDQADSAGQQAKGRVK